MSFFFVQGPDTVDSFVPDLGDFDNFLSEDSSRDAAVREERSLQDGEVRKLKSFLEEI